MGILSAIFKLLGVFFKEILPTLLLEMRKPQEITIIGDAETRDAVNDSVGISLAINDDTELLEPGTGSFQALDRVDGQLFMIICLAENPPRFSGFKIAHEISSEPEVGSEISIMDKHIIYIHPKTKLQTAVHRCV